MKLSAKAEKRWLELKKDFIWLDDCPVNRATWSDDSWYSKDGKKDPLRTVVSHVGIDQIEKFLAKEKHKSYLDGVKKGRDEELERIVGWLGNGEMDVYLGVLGLKEAVGTDKDGIQYRLICMNLKDLSQHSKLKEKC